MGLTLDDFQKRIVRPDERASLFEINPNRKEYVELLDKRWPETKYLLCEDVLVNPYDVRDFLMESSYCTGTNDLIPDKTGAPGMQQPISNEWCKEYVQYLRELVAKFRITRKKVTWYDFSTYTNVFWKGMKAIDSNYLPHVDPSDMAFNLFLSDDLVKEEGTAFFRMNVDGDEFNDIKLYHKQGGRVHPRVISHRMDQCRIGAGIVDEWRYFRGNEVYEQIGVIPAVFNGLSAYRGSVFHTACYDPNWYPDGHARFSLVAMLALGLQGAGKGMGFSAQKPEEAPEVEPLNIAQEPVRSFFGQE